MVLDRRAELERLYRTEPDPDVKERLLLVLKVEGDGMVPSQVAKELHRSRTWASDWMARYRQEGTDGLRTRPKSGRPPDIPSEIAVRIQKKLRESKQGWTTKQAYEMIVKESGVEYHRKHIYKVLHRWGFRQKVPRKVHINTASDDEKEAFKKRQRKS
jgi:transposase